MSSLRELTKAVLQEMVSSVSSPGYKALIVDHESTHILSACCNMYDIMESHISMAAPIYKSREPLPHITALYFISPSEESIQQLIADFEDKPTYGDVHLFFTSRLDDAALEKISLAKVGGHIKALREMNLTYLAPEDNLFDLDDHQALRTFFSPTVANKVDENVKQTARQIVSVCATLGEYPMIRFHKDYPLSTKIAKEVQAELDQLCSVNRDYPMQSSRGTLLVVDRLVDLVAPVLHEFTYQAMTYDVLHHQLHGNKFKVEGQEKEAVLDDNDELWVHTRYKHIAHVTDILKEGTDELLKKSSKKSSSGERSIKEMTELLKTLPMQQRMNEKYELHLDIVGRCFSAFAEQQLKVVGRIEQDLAVGETPDGRKLQDKALQKTLMDMLKDPNISVENKLRVLVVYFVTKPDCPPADKRRYISAAGLNKEQQLAIDNMTLHLSPPGKEEPKKKKKKTKKGKKSDDVPMELSRYVPTLQTLLTGIMEGDLSEENFPFVKPPAAPAGGAAGKRSTAKSRKTINNKESTWASKRKGKEEKQQKNVGPRVIVFVAGGITYSEIRAAAEVSQKYSCHVVVGSHQVLTPRTYIEQLQNLLTL